MTNKSDMSEDSPRRLTVRLTKMGEPERVLEFNAGTDRARVIGCAPNADVVLRDRGVLPVHCYFERDRGDLWLSAAQGEAAIRVNYQPAVGRVKLGKRSILEVGEARLQVLVFEEHENAIRHGQFGTEVIELGDLSAPENLFETTPVDMSVALKEFPTTPWKQTDMGQARALLTGAPTTSTDDGESLMNTVAIQLPVVPSRPVAFYGPTTTERIPRETLATSQELEPIQPVPMSPCILIENRNRLISAPPPPREEAAAPNVGLEGESAPGITLPLRALGAFPIPKPLEIAAPIPAAADEGARRRSLAPSGAASPLLDPGGFATVGHPIPDVFTEAAPAPKSIARRAAPRLIDRVRIHRQRFAAGLGREPKVLAIAISFAALSLTALVSQTVRGWRPIADFYFGDDRPDRAHPVVVFSASPLVSKMLPPSAGTVPEVTPPALSESARSSGGDPMVNQAMNHLLAGRQAEASAAYEVLARRYPGEPVYAIVVRILRRRLNSECKPGNELQCRKALP